jgi:Fic family protein
VDVVSVKAAIKLNDYFEDSYQRIRHFLSVESCEEPQMELLNLLQDSFTTAQAIEIGKLLHVTERTVMNYLKGLEKNRLIHKVKQGNYEKRTLERKNCNK